PSMNFSACSATLRSRSRCVRERPCRARFCSARRSFSVRALCLRAMRRLTISAIDAPARLLLAEGVERNDIGALRRGRVLFGGFVVLLLRFPGLGLLFRNDGD